MRSNVQKAAPPPSLFPTLTLPMLIVVWSVSAALVGFGAGLFEWWYEPERVPPFDTLATYVLWRILSAALAAVVCGLVAYRFRGGREDPTWYFLPGILVMMPISKNHSVPKVLIFGVLMGLVIAGLLRIKSTSVDRGEPASKTDGV